MLCVCAAVGGVEEDCDGDGLLDDGEVLADGDEDFDGGGEAWVLDAGGGFTGAVLEERDWLDSGALGVVPEAWSPVCGPPAVLCWLGPAEPEGVALGDSEAVTGAVGPPPVVAPLPGAPDSEAPGATVAGRGSSLLPKAPTPRATAEPSAPISTTPTTAAAIWRRVTGRSSPPSPPRPRARPAGAARTGRSRRR
ncbi:RodZ family helix-turn-helix domain-containing protein [Streptacidiphilus albus]|uniref:hypothetical protein n=1 Tax=Streptacidiphilus albus TaxID=105425 RepID=UPI0012E09B12|nr:hypothetical protein [Streptacidiphilus albus]